MIQSVKEAPTVVAESLLIIMASRITHLLCMTHTMQLVQSACTCDKSNTLCIPAQSGPQADGSSMPSLVSLPDTALDAILHQLLSCQTLSLVVLHSLVLAWLADLMVEVQKTIMNSFALSPDLHTG